MDGEITAYDRRHAEFEIYGMVLTIGNYIQIRRRYRDDKVLTYYHNLDANVSLWELPPHLVAELKLKLNPPNLNLDRASFCTFFYVLTDGFVLGFPGKRVGGVGFNKLVLYLPSVGYLRSIIGTDRLYYSGGKFRLPERSCALGGGLDCELNTFPLHPISHFKAPHRLISNLEAIPNSEWRKVYTSGGARFFFNPITNERTWEVPHELRAKPPIPGSPPPVSPAAPASPHTKGQPPSGGTEMTEADVAHQLAAMGIETTLGEVPTAYPAPELPYHERVQKFKVGFQDLLLESKVSAFEPWDQVLPRIIHDPRYALLATHRERKQHFDQHCREQAKQPSREQLDPKFVSTTRKPKLQSAKDAYRQLVEEHASHKSTWIKFNKQHFSDPRSQAVPYKEREKLFLEYVEALHASRKRETKERKARHARAEEEFIELLGEVPGSGQTRIEGDRRFRSIKREKDREEMFRDYVKNRARTKRELDEPDATTEEERRRRRQEASLRQREQQVRQEQQALHRQEHHQLKRMDHQNDLALYQTLLAGTIKQPDVPFKEAKLRLEKDERFRSLRLAEAELERLYNEHADHLHSQRVQAFRKLVEAACKLDAKVPPPGLLEEPAALQLGSGEELQRYFQRIQASRVEQAKEAFCHLLDQSPYLRFKARAYPKAVAVVLDDAGLQDLETALANDPRFTCLDFMAPGRAEILRAKFAHLATQERLNAPEASARRYRKLTLNPRRVKPYLQGLTSSRPYHGRGASPPKASPNSNEPCKGYHRWPYRIYHEPKRQASKRRLVGDRIS
ncbi:hypothetical protein L0F63_002015 [Massospora cicadina]|nr:hypothetical protein L0F63_002015 [Massospora cicadina]